MKTKHGWIAAFVLSGVVGCGAPVESVSDESRETASEAGKGDIFGEDDRMEGVEVAGGPLERAVRATAAMVKRSEIAADGDNLQVVANIETLAERRNLCADHPYAPQPSWADCSGFLVAPDLLVTAGHCMVKRDMSLQQKCDETTWIFDYEYADEEAAAAGGIPPLRADNVYNCAEVVDAQHFDCSVDYALIRLDRPVNDREPIQLTSGEKPELGTEMLGIGFPNGIPMKVSPGEVVDLSKYTTTSSFETNIDGFGGNSGSPVVDSNGVVHGIHVCGNPRGEYERQDDRDCTLPFDCNDGVCRGMGTYQVSNIRGLIDCVANGGEDCTAAAPEHVACDPFAPNCADGTACGYSSKQSGFYCLPSTDYVAGAGEDCFADRCDGATTCRKFSDGSTPERRCLALCDTTDQCSEANTCHANRVAGYGLCY